MGAGRFSIRYKLGLALVIAVGLPLLIGLISVHLLGRRHYRAAQGQLFESISHDLALGLGMEIDHQVELLGSWLQNVDIAGEIDQGSPLQSIKQLDQDVEQIEKEWPNWNSEGPELKRWLANSLSEKIRLFLSHNPFLAEVLITDRYGRLVAANAKTSDYFQADEKWWQCVFDQPRATGCLFGVNYDQSAEVYSIDIAMPIHNHADLPVGVVKCIVKINPLLTDMEQRLNEEDQIREVVLGDGRILLRFMDDSLEPFQTSFNPELLERMKSDGQGWLVMSAIGPNENLAGFSEIKIGSSAEFPTHTEGLQTLYMVVRYPLDSVMAPVGAQLRLLSASGLLLAVVCLLGGFYFSNHQILQPVNRLKSAAQAIAAWARLDGRDRKISVSEIDLKNSMRQLDLYMRENPADEIGLLTSDFLLMAKRVLSYHRQMERELASKTAEISRDMMLAREFQEALLPHSYPRVPVSPSEDEMKLNFYHLYKPASLVSGDLVHMLQLSDHRAAVFVADVMGHGTRSALISAILRTLVQNASVNSKDPAELMETVNRQFLELIPKGSDLVFATAVYAIFDTLELTAEFAVAGHPSPLLINRHSGLLKPVIDAERNDPAIGLVEDARYKNIIISVHADCTFLLFTDGVVEAANKAREEFGDNRLQATIKSCRKESGQEIATAIMEALDRFMDTAVTRDDICLVTVDVDSNEQS